AIREIFKVLADPTVISFAAGSPSPEAFPTAELSAISAELFSGCAAEALQYGITEGYGPLRELTAARLRALHRIGAPDDDLIITTGGQQGLDLAARVLLNEGDTVVCEDPSFIGALNGLRAAGARLVGVPMDTQGMDMEALAQVLRDMGDAKCNGKCKCIYTIPTFQNPGGTTLPLDRREKMLALARQYDVLILEDDPYCELRYTGSPVPSLKSMDQDGRVLYLGSYSKTVSPGVRVGFACGPREVIARMTTAKQVTDVHTNLFFQVAIARLLERYDFDAHIARCRALYARKLDRMFGYVASWGGKVSCVKPDGGLFLWCRLPQGRDGTSRDGTDFCKIAGRHKVAAVPGATFSTVQGAASDAFRLNFSLPSLAQIDSGMSTLTQVLDEYL
ncbi:MAG: PLP-dependent aminotransferase family protein, partial [Oscillospiraceae bacterium]|nr:PLP-dependent aminotransferase family protein [Oscillospiraceae bacterium]